MSDIVERLRGQYRVPINDGLGPAGGEEPNNPNEFVRTFQTPPIQHEAADEIERLRAALRWQEDRDAKGNGSTHAGDCYTWGPRHYECALAKIKAMEAENAALKSQEDMTLGSIFQKQKAENERLREALAFYANPEIYKPHPHGPAFDRKANLYETARAALAGK